MVLYCLQAVPEARLEIAGDGDHRPALEAEIERRGLADRVVMHGHVEEERKTELYARAWVALTATVFLSPVALWLAVRWAFLAQVVELEDASALGALRRSGELVRGRWFRVASLVGIGLVLALAIGPLIGALLIIFTQAPFVLLNVVSGIVYALAMPFVAITTTYLYFDARVRSELEPREAPADLPAEIELA